MANPFYQIVKQRINPIVKPYGFRIRDRFYHRIINNVVQQFCLLHLARDFTIRFHISSVYDDNYRTMEGDEVHRLIDGTNDWFGTRVVGKLFGLDVLENPYADMKPETLQKAADICANALEKYLLPWFSQTTTSEDALNASRSSKLTDFYKRYDEPDDQEIGFLLDMDKYEAVAEILNYYIQNSDKYNKSWWQETGPEYKKLYTAIIKDDQSYIHNYMEQKKAATYTELKWKARH
ncbi:MAG: hypothetical protein WA125_08370 [Desulfosporosinus sp.]